MKSLLTLSLGTQLTLRLVSAGTQNVGADQEPLKHQIDPTKYKAACPDYKHYAMGQQYVSCSPIFKRVLTSTLVLLTAKVHLSFHSKDHQNIVEHSNHLLLKRSLRS